jgi:hypothetical protein
MGLLFLRRRGVNVPKGAMAADKTFNKSEAPHPLKD